MQFCEALKMHLILELKNRPKSAKMGVKNITLFWTPKLKNIKHRKVAYHQTDAKYEFCYILAFWFLEGFTLLILWFYPHLRNQTLPVYLRILKTIFIIFVLETRDLKTLFNCWWFLYLYFYLFSHLDMHIYNETIFSYLIL